MSVLFATILQQTWRAICAKVHFPHAFFTPQYFAMLLTFSYSIMNADSCDMNPS